MRRFILAFFVFALTLTAMPQTSKALSAEVQELVNSFEEVYYGLYSDDLNVLFALGEREGIGFVAMTDIKTGIPTWVCLGELQNNSGGLRINDEELGNQYDFSILSRSAGGITLKLEEGELTLKKGNINLVTKFFTDMESGAFEE